MVKQNRIKPCRNCGRKKVIQRDGLCGGCAGSVYNKYTKGTPEYDAALAAAKERFNNPNSKPLPRERNAMTTKTIPPENIKKLKIRAKTLMTIKHNGGDPGLAGVIATLQIEHDALIAKADKLSQAISLLL